MDKSDGRWTLKWEKQKQKNGFLGKSSPFLMETSGILRKGLI